MRNIPEQNGQLNGTDGARVSAVDRMVDLIRDLIAERGLQLGDPLPTERELGELYVASRNTVREALQVLRAYGIVETRPKVGAVLSARTQRSNTKAVLVPQRRLARPLS